MAKHESLGLDNPSAPILLEESQNLTYAKSHEVRVSTSVLSIETSSTKRTSRGFDDVSKPDACLGASIKVSDYEPRHSGAASIPYQPDADGSDCLKTVSTPKNPSAHRSKACCPSWGVWKEYWHYSWFAEVLSCCGAVICLCVIVITLSMQQGKTLPQWPLNISINALLSIFTAILKATLALPLTEGISQLKWQWFTQHPHALNDLDRFDSASRGPWGSSLFLFKVNMASSIITWRRPWKIPTLFLRRSGDSAIYVAQFAAFITVLGLAIDPFSQQVLHYVDCSQNDSSITALLSRTNVYSSATTRIAEPQDIMNEPMTVVINTALANPLQNMTYVAPFQCGSGNCTFTQFSTLGICHSCEDISDQVVIDDEHALVSNVTLPASLRDNAPELWLNPIGLLNTSAKCLNIPEIMQLRILSLPHPYGQSSGPSATAASAFHCTLTPCTKTYNASVTKSILNETLISTETIGLNQLFGEGIVGNDAMIAYLLATSRTLVNGRWESCQASMIPGPGHVKVAAANVDASPMTLTSQNQTFNESYYREDCVWQLGYFPALAIKQELTKALNLQMMATAELVDDPEGGVITQSIWRNGSPNLASIDGLMQNLSDAMTAFIRHGGDDGPPEWVSGQAMVNSTCIDVRWVWLSYSTALVGLAIVFQVLLVIQMPREVVDKAWKSSSLPLLFCSLDDALKQQIQSGSTKDDMIKLAETTNAQLVDHQRGPVFM